jgi:hypothetical protein
MSAAPGELEIGREEIALLDRVLVLSIDPDLVAVRIYGANNEKPEHAIGVSAARALRIGALFIRAAMRLDPSLTPEVVAQLRARGGVAK